MTTVTTMRQVRAGRIVRDITGQWQTVAATEHRAGGWIVLRYADGSEEEGPGDAPRTILPKLTDPQFRTLQHVAAGRILVNAEGDTVLQGGAWVGFWRPLRHLAAEGLVVFAGAGRPGAYQLTDAGRAYLDGVK